MATLHSAAPKASRDLEDQQKLLNSELMNEVFEMKCSSASRPSSGVQSGLRHRLPHNTTDYYYDAVNNDAQECCLLSDRLNTTSKGGLKVHGGLAKCMEKYFSACRSNVNSLLRRKPRRPARSTKLVNPLKNKQYSAGLLAEHADQITHARLAHSDGLSVEVLKQTDSAGEDSSTMPCFGRGCWRGLRRKFGDMIKFEDETARPISRSILYYA